MSARHSKATIISIAILASATATLLHEAVGHGVTAWLRGDIPTELTSNHLSSGRVDKWVQAGGTLVNLFAGAVSLVLSRDRALRAKTRYFLALFAAFNLLAGAGYFLFSGIIGVGDWADVIRGWPQPVAIRVAMSLIGAGLYLLAMRLIMIALQPFLPDRCTYNSVGRLPYVVACLFSCAAGALDPLGWKLFLLSTVPAAFGGYSGLLWADVLLPRTVRQPFLTITRAPGWWVAAVVFGAAYVFVLGRGISLPH